MDAESVGEIICKNRKKLHMTQKELANQIGVTDKAVSKWERGIGLPDINMIEPLSESLEISVAEIITGNKKSDMLLREKEVDEVLKLSLEYAQKKITKAIHYCIPALIVNWVILLSGVCFLFYSIQEIGFRCLAILLLIISTQLSGRVLVELMRQKNEGER